MSKELSVAQWAVIAGLNVSDEMIAGQINVGFEELTEIITGLCEKNFQEIVDGVVDSYWMKEVVNQITEGKVNFDKPFAAAYSAVEKKYPGLLEAYFKPFLASVLESNYSKFCTSELQVEATIVQFADIGVKVYATNTVEGYWCIHSCEDQHGTDGVFYPAHKVMKGVNFFKPKLVVEYTPPVKARGETVGIVHIDECPFIKEQ